MKSILILFLSLIAFKTWADEKPLTVGILLYSGVQIIDYTGPYEIFGWAGYQVSTVTEDGKSVFTNMNMQVTPNYSFKNAPQFDVLLIPGGNQHNAMHSKTTLTWIKSQAPAAKHLVSVCTGVFILAETGLLDNLSATTFYPSLGELKTNYPKISTVTNMRFVDNGKIITAAGLSSGIDVALHVVAQHRGLPKAKSIAMAVEYPWTPENGFVRGNMADTQLQSLGGTLPQHLKFDELYSYGDETEWFAAYKVSSTQTLSPKVLSTIITDAMTKNPEWKTKTNQQSRWYKMTIGIPWILDIDYSQVKDSIQLSLHLHKKRHKKACKNNEG